MSNLDELAELKSKTEKLQRQASQAEGAYKQAMKQMETEFGCKTIEEAKAKLRKLKRQEEAARAKFEESLAAFKEEYKDVL
jgi:predicted  nucleic acid-binding Zn-ribbon protein